MSLVSARKFKLENEVKGKSRCQSGTGGKPKIPPDCFSTVQIGITAIGDFIGYLQWSQHNGDLNLCWYKQDWHLYTRIIDAAVGVVVVLITYFSIVFGELLPKRIGLTYPETIAILWQNPWFWQDWQVRLFGCFHTKWPGAETAQNRLLTKVK